MKKLIITIFLLMTLPLFAAGEFYKGKNAYIYRNYDKAKEYFLKDIEKNDRGDSYYFMGEIEKILKNYKSAFQYYEKAVTKRMTRKYMINAYWNLIVLTEETNDYNKVVHYCREMWNRTRDSSAKRKVESLINKMLWTSNESAIEKYKEGREMLKRGKKEEAYSLFSQAINIDSTFLAPKFELGMKAYNQNNESEALRHLSEISYRIPYYAEIQLILGDINYKGRNYSTAVNNFTAVIDFGFISNSLYYKTLLKRGDCNYHSGNYSNAEEDLTRVLKYLKKNLNAHLLLSATYIKQSKYDEALSTLKQADRLSKDNPLVLFQIGSIYYHNKDWRYVSYFERLFDKIRGEDTDRIKSYDRAMKILLKALFEKKKHPKAIEVAEQIHSYSNDYSTMLILAKSYYHNRKYEKSIEIFTKLSIGNTDKVVLAKAYLKTGRRQEAKSLLNNIYYDSTAISEAKKDYDLNKIIMEIVKDKTSSNIQNTQNQGTRTSGGTSN